MLTLEAAIDLDDQQAPVNYTALNKQFIHGQWVDGQEDAPIDNLNPFTNEVIHTLHSAGTTDVDVAFEAAKQAFPTWAATNPLVRRDILLKAAAILLERQEEFIDWLTRETGSTYLKGLLEVQQSHDILVEASSFPTRMHGRTTTSTIDGKETYVYRKPLGVVSLISPWNFPLYLSMRTIAPALAVGNTMVVKPASQSLVTGGTIIAKLLEEAGIPAGVFNVVVGRSDIMGDYFTAHPYSRMVSFTGSTPVGKGIGRIAGEGLKKSALELGGNNVFMVLDDADVDKAVDGAVFGRFLHQGQVCMATNRIIIHESLYEEFKTKFVARVNQLPYGDPADKSTVVGPLIDHKSVQRILGILQSAVADGAVVETGNRAEGNVLHPTVLSGVTKHMRVFKEEIFGPAVGLVSFANDEEAIELANATDFGLSGALYTRDIYRGMQLARRVETGMMHINDQSANDEVHTPFGGEKSSGTGRFGGDFILEELTTVQWVSVQKVARQYPF
ncbi:aldehyde dehydrogenase family protein [Spirosoma sp. KCTC 42546]|uniref:aldehyde dehydrogenase family protein n=1 Tax=Spirosoma sp. KCTC 42546 TaxID=2520506 RepID=UPI001158CCE0|nr:aldehyde dehydrogenase family protein [Spirosoma sp. KCTC 42546]QDK77531.1 aldehyde dehydrogenase family protein [Spirosoma sp. KCTC 42546]